MILSDLENALNPLHLGSAPEDNKFRDVDVYVGRFGRAICLKNLFHHSLN